MDTSDKSDDASGTSLSTKHQIIVQQLNNVTKFSDEWFRLKNEEVELRVNLVSEERRAAAEGVVSKTANNDGCDKAGCKNSNGIQPFCTRGLNGLETIENEIQAHDPTASTGHLFALPTCKKSLADKTEQTQRSLPKSDKISRAPLPEPFYDTPMLRDDAPLFSIYGSSVTGQETNCKNSHGVHYDYRRNFFGPEIIEDINDLTVPNSFCQSENMGQRLGFSKSSLSGKRHTLENVPIAEIEMPETYSSTEEAHGRSSIIPVKSQASDLSFGHGEGVKSQHSRSTVLSVKQGRLAVAYPRKEPSINELIYEASEYDPSSNTSFYKSVRCRVYTAILVLILGAIVAVGVVYGLKKKIDGNGIDDEASKYPEMDPVTPRESLGLQDIIESDVLERNAKFNQMDDSDPRYLALEWILRQDKFEDNKNLLQRYVLALIAFTLDLDSWNCGAVYEVESCNETDVVDDYSLWLSDSSECLWYGVSCDDGIVTGLDLSSNNLIGEIPPEIGGLRFLEMILFKDNCLYGTLPPELWKLTNLIEINVEGNALHGMISSELYYLSSLTTLNLASNKNEGDCNHTDGSVTTVSSTGLEGNILEPKIGNLTKLREISVSSNSFNGSIPSEIGSLTQLEIFSAYKNAFSGSLPREISHLSNLVSIRIGFNKITGRMPERIGNMKALEQLSFNDMAMVGTIPDSLYNLTNLKALHLENNSPGFNGPVKSEIGNLLQLVELYLNDNPLLSGTLPSELGFCQNLTVIQVHGTQLGGTVPPEVCALHDMNLNLDHSFWTEEFFKADCSPDNGTLTAFISCDCCSTCCDHTTKLCLHV